MLVGLALVLPGTLLSVEGRYSEETRGKSLCDQSVLLKRRRAHTAVVCAVVDCCVYLGIDVRSGLSH